MRSSMPAGRSAAGLVGLLIVLAALMIAAGCTQTDQKKPVAPVTTTPVANMPNPASAACVQNGGTVQILKNADGSEYGMCTFANGTSCEEWALFRNEGCKPGSQAAPAATAAEQSGGKKMVTLTESDKGKTTDIAQGTRFAVQLAENPTTGFQWNATVSPGLVIQSSDYAQDPATKGLMGAGGTHTWVIQAKDTGVQTFSAIYLRSWEPVTGNETAYSTTINVVKS